jgi:uncharacterized protein (DUF1800 family)
MVRQAPAHRRRGELRRPAAGVNIEAPGAERGIHMKGLRSGAGILIAAGLLLVAACGSSSPDSVIDAATGGGDGGSSAKLGAAEAARLLTQGTFGPTRGDIDRVATLSARSWVDEQLRATPTHHLPLCRSLAGNDGVDRNARTDAWWQIALTAPDQLRQRVAFALSEIMVVSDTSDALSSQGGLCWYYDLLVDGAFGNYRDLLEDVTLSPEMGRYLSMLGNAKPDAATDRRADENFAREVMQLFTIGLVQLNADGTPRLDASGAALPSYTQADIEGLARTFTGWSWGGARSFSSGPANWLAPMKGFDDAHDRDAKTIVGNTAIAASGSAVQDLARGLDTLFEHANVGPFIGRQLIQKLVTSNPSPAYVERVARAFADNGRGQRGDLAAVVRAVLLDSEARGAPTANFGKAREPLLRQAHLWRALDAVPATASGRYSYRSAQGELLQSPLSSPSVFNFYSPFYSPAGEVRSAQLVLPELQLANESSITLAQNRLYRSLYGDYRGRSGVSDSAILVDYAALLPLAADPSLLLDELDLLLLSGQMPADMRSALLAYLQGVDASKDGGRARVQEAAYLILASPQYSIQR